MQRTGELLLQQIFGNPALFGGQAVFGAQDAAWADTVAECSRSRPVDGLRHTKRLTRSEEHTSELQSLMRISYAVFCLKKKKNKIRKTVMKDIQQKKDHDVKTKRKQTIYSTLSTKSKNNTRKVIKTCK